MGTIQIKYKPELDAARLCDFFKTQFQGKYEVYTTARRQNQRQIMIHGQQTVVVVKKNWFCGAFVLIEQKPNSTRLKIWSDPPSDGFFKASLFLALLIVPLLIIIPLLKIMSHPVIRDVRNSLQQFQ